jgi:hypothetical protein
LSADDAAKLLGAASHADDRAWRLVLLAEAKILIAREAERLVEVRLLLTEMEKEFLETRALEQTAIAARGGK